MTALHERSQGRNGLADSTATPADSGATTRPTSTDELILHALEANLQAIAATAHVTTMLTEAALATIAALKSAGHPQLGRQLQQIIENTTPARRPRTEREAKFFGQIHDSQQPTAASSSTAGTIADGPEQET